MKHTVTVRECIFIKRSPGDVWDYTQDYSKRAEWDSSIKGTTVLQETPRRVDVRGPGLCAELVYKQDERPLQTSLSMENIRSLIVSGGGGSWKYDAVNDGTEWMQTNTLVLRPSKFMFVLKPMLQYMLRTNTRKAMKKAKRILEK